MTALEVYEKIVKLDAEKAEAVIAPEDLKARLPEIRKRQSE